MAHTKIWEDRGFYRKFTDKVTGDEVLADILAVHGDPRFDRLRYAINDFTEITDFEINEQEIKKISVFDHIGASINPRIKIAIIATCESLLEWVYLYIDYMQDSAYDCKVFGNLEDARQWVGY